MTHCPPLLLAQTSPAPQDQAFALVGILILVVVAMATAILILTHLIGPKRRGAIKSSTYESGVDPVGDTRRRFNVGFYMVAMLFLLFDVEIAFFYPWAMLFPRLSSPTGEIQKSWMEQMVAGGFTSGFLLIEMFVFVGILLVGYVYAWRKGVFKWN